MNEQALAPDADATAYEPYDATEGAYVPGGPDAPHYTIKNAKNQSLNGDVRFRYPTVFDHVRMGARETQIAGSLGARFEELGRHTKMLLRAIVTLEFVVDVAPEGFYTTSSQGKPVLAPGLIQGSDSQVVFDTYIAYTAWAESLTGDGDADE